MKFKTTLLLGILFLVATSFKGSVDAGIAFHHGNYAAAKKIAKQTNKTIFIDGYTEWCGPCKRMAKEVFTDAAVGKYFNENFINVKMDMEKTDGMLVSRRYSVNFYPTLLFIRPNGELIRKEVGFKNKSELLTLAREANY